MSPPSTTDAAGVLLVGHGTRSERGRSQFLSLADQVRQRLNRPLEPAFLELAEPTIAQAVERLVARGIQRLIVAPLLLFAAGHAKEDVPSAVAQALSRCGIAELPLHQTEPFGCHPLIVELAQQRVLESLAGRAVVPQERTLLLAVGRGSTDEAATAEMHQFAALLAERAGMQSVRVAFLAMARPQLAEAIAEVDEQTFSRVIVQPHLLFHGELVERLHRQVDQIAAQRPGQEWMVTGLLAENELLAAATVDLIERALAG
ncbi:MAG TPA: sirohydrochlorin chelatase [Pirellulaceae bacterium]|nr:sirohydrochlorin chelatase [Pirellulaceae bacterium]